MEFFDNANYLTTEVFHDRKLFAIAVCYIPADGRPESVLFLKFILEELKVSVPCYPFQRLFGCQASDLSTVRIGYSIVSVRFDDAKKPPR